MKLRNNAELRTADKDVSVSGVPEVFLDIILELSLRNVTFQIEKETRVIHYVL